MRMPRRTGRCDQYSRSNTGNSPQYCEWTAIYAQHFVVSIYFCRLFRLDFALVYEIFGYF